MRATVASVAGLPAAGPASAQMLDFNKPVDAQALFRKIQCATKDNVPVVCHWSGRFRASQAGICGKNEYPLMR